MFITRERESVRLKALEQAIREAGLAQTEPEPLLPTPVGAWPFRLSKDDIVFLRSCPYPISPA